MSKLPVPRYRPPSNSCHFGVGKIKQSTWSPRSTFSKTGPSFTTSAGIVVIPLRTRSCHMRTSSCGDAFGSNPSVTAIRPKEPSPLERTRNPFLYPLISSKSVAFEGRVRPRSSVAMPMSASVFAPRTVWSSPSASTRLSQSRRSVGVPTLVSTAMSASQPLRLVVVKGTRQRPGSPTVVGYGEAVLRRQLDPDPLIAAELRGRVRAGPKLGPGDVDDAVEVVAEEGGDSERPGELVRLTPRRGVDKDPFGPEDEERSRAR